MTASAMLFAAALIAAEPNDMASGAAPFSTYATGVIDYVGDPEWWRLRRDHAPAITLYVDTGTGALCGCPKGDPAIITLRVYDGSGALLFAHAGSSAGLEILPIAPLPIGVPVWLELSGVPVGPYGWSPYRLLVF